MEPAIGVDAEGFAGKLLEFGGTLDGFKQREKAYREGLARGNVTKAGTGGRGGTYDAHPGSLGKQGRAGALWVFGAKQRPTSRPWSLCVDAFL